MCLLLSIHIIAESKSYKISPIPGNSAGLFAISNLVLGHLYLWEIGAYEGIASGLTVDFDVNGNYYDESLGPNFWEYYFEPIHVGNVTNPVFTFLKKEMNNNAWLFRRKMTREEAAAIISKYVKIRQPIMDKINAFIAKKFTGFFVIGVHYRGTDKKSEAPRVPYDDVIKTISEKIKTLSGQDYKIFVATDEEAFLKKIQSVFPEKMICTDALRSKTMANIHHSDHSPYLLGEQAVMDAYLLSQANLLIRTSSNLSLWSTYWNLSLPVIRLNDRFILSTE